MRKLLLSIFMLVAVVATSFGQVSKSLTMSDLTWEIAAPIVSTTAEGFDIVGDKKTGATNPTYNSTNKDLRIYANGTLMIESSVGNISKVVINISAQGLKRWSATNSVNSGTLTNDVDSKTITWEGDAASFTITVGANSGLGTDGATKAGQLCISSIDITYSGVAPSVTAPEFSKQSGNCLEPFELTISAVEDATIHYTLDGTAPTTASAVYSTALTISETTTVKAIAVLDGKASSVTSETYTFPVTLSSIADFYELGKEAEGDPVIFGCPLNVVHYNNSNSGSASYLYVVDAAGSALQIYSSKGLDAFENGHIIPAGLEGNVGVYGGEMQLSPDVTTFGSLTKGEAATPKEITVADASANKYLAQYIVLKNVTFDTTNKMIVDGDATVAYYVRFASATAVPTDAKAYDMEGIHTTYNGKNQIFPISFVEATGTGIAGLEAATATIAGGFGQVEITATENAEVLIVNTLGQAVASKNIAAGATTIGVAPGLYIVKVGQQVTKVVVR